MRRMKTQLIAGLTAGTCLLAAGLVMAQEENYERRDADAERQWQQQQTQEQQRAPAAQPTGRAQQDQRQPGAQRELDKDEIALSEEEARQTVTDVNRASKLVGMTVRNKQDENIGRISDLAIDLESGRVAYAVLSHGGVFGFGGKLIAVPIQAFTPAPGENHVLLDIDQQTLDQAPGFSRNNWPDMNEEHDGRTVGLAPTPRPDRQQDAVGGTADDPQRARQQQEQEQQRQQDQQFDEQPPRDQEPPDAVGGTADTQARGEIRNLQELTRGDTANLDGRKINVSQASVQQVHEGNVITITDAQGEEVLVRSATPVADLQAGQTVSIIGTVRRIPADTEQLGLSRQAAELFQGQTVYIDATQLKPQGSR
jgi:sporulation protein YlmC with PRC-barrel domain